MDPRAALRGPDRLRVGRGRGRPLLLGLLPALLLRRLRCLWRLRLRVPLLSAPLVCGLLLAPGRRRTLLRLTPGGLPGRVLRGRLVRRGPRGRLLGGGFL